MKEIVKLSHTAEFHDKEVDYIVWKRKAELSKLISPKKPSFERTLSDLQTLCGTKQTSAKRAHEGVRINLKS